MRHYGTEISFENGSPCCLPRGSKGLRCMTLPRGFQWYGTLLLCMVEHEKIALLIHPNQVLNGRFGLNHGGVPAVRLFKSELEGKVQGLNPKPTNEEIDIPCSTSVHRPNICCRLWLRQISLGPQNSLVHNKSFPPPSPSPTREAYLFPSCISFLLACCRMQLEPSWETTPPPPPPHPGGILPRPG